MGHHCCSKQKVKRGLWSPEEDEKLIRYITTHGHDCWSSVPKQAGLQRCGKSCRLRWINYLRPDLKRGSFSAQEERIIIDVHRILGNRWAQIAKHLPGRTDNEVKNFWNSCIKKKLIAQGLDPKTHNLMPPSSRAAPTAAMSSSNSSSHVPRSGLQDPQETPTTPFAIISTNTMSSQEGRAKSGPSFNICTHMEIFEDGAAVTCSSRMDMSPTFLLKPQVQDDAAVPVVPTFNYNDPSAPLVFFNDQFSSNVSTASTDNAIFPYPFNPYQYVEESCMPWGSDCNADKQLQSLKQGGLQEEEPHVGCGTAFVSSINEERCHDLDAMLHGSSFDLDLMATTLLSGGEFDGENSLDELQWSC